MSINRLYDTWKARIMELRPGQRVTQVRAFVWLLVGIYLCRAAGKIPGKAKLTSTTQTIRAGLRHLVDRKERRDLCIFQIGLRFLERRLVNDLSFRIPSVGTFSTKLSGS